MESLAKKVAVVGLDGATFDLILPWVEKGYLPTFERLLQQGAYGPLHSTIHPISPQAWSGFATGKNAGKHGIFDFLVKKTNSYQFALTQGGGRQAVSLWELLSESEKRVMIVNVPFTYPPEKVNGIMLSGFDAPKADETFCYPPTIYDEIVDEVGQYFLHEMYPVGYNKDEYEQVLHSEIKNRVDVSDYLLKTQPWDFFMIVFNATDLVQHLFWAEMEDLSDRHRDVILHVYQAIDTAVAKIWAMLGEDDTMLVVSDHGAGPIKKSMYLNEWLSRQGWLKFKEQKTTSRFEQIIVPVVDKSRKFAKQFLPRSVKDVLKSKFPTFRNQVESWIRMSPIDWVQTSAFSAGNFGNIYINVKEREPNGIVISGQEYDKLVQEICEALYNLRDPETNELVVEKVHRRENLYSGEFSKLAPDLIVQWKDYAYFCAPQLGGPSQQVFGPVLDEDATEFQHSGTHRLDGILFAVGPKIKHGPVDDASILDITPTVLYAQGLPIPNDLDGQILQSIFNETRQVQYISPSSRSLKHTSQTYSSDDEADMIERLRSLGYMD